MALLHLYPLYLALFWFEFPGNLHLSQALNECAVNKQLWCLGSKSVTLSENCRAAEGVGMILLFWPELGRCEGWGRCFLSYSFLKNNLQVCVRIYNYSRKHCVGHFSEHNDGTFYKRINIFSCLQRDLYEGGSISGR